VIGSGSQNTLVLSTPAGKLRDATSNLPQQADFSHSAAATDVNGDGTIDLYVGNLYTDAEKFPPEILLNDGTGRFRPCADCLPALPRGQISVPWHPRLLDGPTYSASEFVDVNADGARDLALRAVEALDNYSEVIVARVSSWTTSSLIPSGS
jgi:hypothetical protein